MTAFVAIVKLTCKSVVRSHVFRILMFLLLFTIVALPLTVVGDGTARAYIQVSLKYCLGAVGFILSLSSIWLGCFTMSDDIESYKLHMVVSKPISRITVWLGKCVGILLIHSVLLLISAFAVYILILCKFQDQMFLSYTILPVKVLIGLSALTLLISLISASTRIARNLSPLRLLTAGKLDHAAFSNLLWRTGLISFTVLAISCVMFVALKWQFNKSTFSAIEKIRIRNEVLVGRRVYMPDRPNIRRLTIEKFKKRIAMLPAKRRILTKTQKNNLLREIAKETLSELGEVKAADMRRWTYQGLEPGTNTPLFLRYRAYIGKVSSKDQRQTMGLWAAQMHVPESQFKQQGMKNAKTKKRLKTVFAARSAYPERIACGVFNEIVLPPYIIAPDGTALVSFTNYDPQKKTLFFQIGDGPKLLKKVTGFPGNYARGIFMIFVKLLFLTGLSCAVGGLLSAPVAIFAVISYLLFGAFSTYLVGIQEKMLSLGGPAQSETMQEMIGNALSNLMVFIIIPMQNFEVSDLLSGGELIELSFMVKVIFVNLILKGLPLICLGMLLYRKRELGLVVRK
jgi:hypothetical protein